MSQNRTVERGASVSVASVTKSYHAADGTPLLALDTIDMDVSNSEFVTIVGPSGCGKSTLLMIIAGLLAADTGAVTINSSKVTSPYVDAGVVFQNDVLLEWRRAEDNLLLQTDMRGLPRGRYHQRARDLLRMAGLEGFERRFPFELSGGMRQRVAICRALMLEPPLLLMDEPFGALDAITREQMQIELGHYVVGGTTVIFVTHSIDEAVFLSDRIVVMSNRPGSVAATISIDLERPRKVAMKASPEFERHAQEIRTIFLGSGVLKERT